MPKKKSENKSESDREIPKHEEDLPTIDYNLSLYELTDLFYASWHYHSSAEIMSYTSYNLVGNEVKKKTVPISRFGSLKRVEVAYLSPRPFPGQQGVNVNRPNTSKSYMKRFLRYVSLPYKAILSEKQYVKLQINRSLFDLEKLSDQEREQQVLEEGGIGNAPLNADVSDYVGDAFNKVLSITKEFQEAFDVIPRRLAQDGLIAFLHSDLDWRVTTVQALDLITEPQASIDPDTWSYYFVIRKLTAAEARQHIQDKTEFWNVDALRWALDTCLEGNSIVTGQHHRVLQNEDKDLEGENFAIRSFLSDKSARMNNIGAYYGNMYVAEGYYKNDEGKINKVIFFPSSLFRNIPPETRKLRESTKGTEKEDLAVKGAEVLFLRENVRERMSETITLLVIDRSETVLERQRGYGHDLFPVTESLMRVDSNIESTINMMANAFYREGNSGEDAESSEDLEMQSLGGFVNLGDRELIQNFFQSDLNGMIGGKQMLLAEAASICFLGGLDNMEKNSEGRGGQIANLTLVRDGRIHKHGVVDFVKGLKPLFGKSLSMILKMITDEDHKDDVLLNYVFYEPLVKIFATNKDLLKFDEKELIADTYLPYWIMLEVLSNGAGSFGPAEIVILNEIKNMFGDGLSQKASQKLARIGITSMMGSQEANDILGTPESNKVTDSDQIHEASMETASLLGSVESDAIRFIPIPVRMDKDDHVGHLGVHNKTAQEIITELENADFSPAYMQTASADELSTRSNKILRLAALSTHISEHAQALEKFGHKRADVNQLKEETNNILQAAESLLKNLQINARATLAKRDEEQARLQNISPENEVAKEELRIKAEEVSVKRLQAMNTLAVANKVDAEAKRQHDDKQVTAARNRQSKERIEALKAEVKLKSEMQKNAKNQLSESSN